MLLLLFLAAGAITGYSADMLLPVARPFNDIIVFSVALGGY